MTTLLTRSLYTMLQPSSGRHAASPVHVTDNDAVAELVVTGIDDGLVEDV